MGIALERRDVRGGSAVSSRTWRDDEPMAPDGAGRRNGLVGPGIGHLEHHEVIDGHRIVDINEVPFFGMNLRRCRNRAIGLHERGSQRGKIAGVLVSDDCFELPRIRQLRARHIEAVQAIQDARELGDELLHKAANAIDLSNRPDNLLEEVAKGSENVLDG